MSGIPVMNHQHLFRTLFCLLLLNSALGLRAQNNAVNLEDQGSVKLVTKFPFRQYYGGVVVIRATLNNIPDTLQFILDTGSAGISLDTATSVRLGLKLIPSDRIVRGLGASRQVSFAENCTLNLPGLKVDSLNFHINDYELISQVYGLQIDGIIGYSLLSRYIMTVDYDIEEIGVYTQGRVRYPRGGHLLKPNISNIPIVAAPLRNGKKNIDHRYYFDTGAGMCLLLCNQFVNDSTILVKKKNKVIQTEAQGLGGKMTMSITTMQEFRLGPYSFRNVPTYLFDDVTNITQYPSLAGMVGNDLLRRFNLILNYERREIFLLPNTHYRDQFDYSYTGLILYLIDGRIEVTDVIKASPAEKAGFKKGDIIVAISNNFSSNLQVYRELLKNVGSRPTMLVMRDKELMLKKIQIRSIL